MKVILTGTEGWAIDGVARDLRQRGHDVLLCSEPDAAVFPCIGLSETAACPIDDGAEVIVTVRAHPIPEPTRREVSITCALLRGLPLVVAGSTVLNPFESIASAVIEGYDGIDEACRTVVDSPSRAGRPVEIRAGH